MFTPGQHVIYNGQLYTFERDATSIGEAPRVDKNGKPYRCEHALVTPVGGAVSTIVHRASLRAVADTVVPESPTSPAAPHPEPTPRRPRVIDLIKADALDLEAERLEDFAESLRSEARTLRGEI